MPTLAMAFDLLARDRASATFARVGTSAETAGKKAEASSKQMRHFAEAIGAIALVEAGKKSLQMAGDFQQSTNVLVTAAGETQSNLGKVRKGIMDIAVGTGTPLKELTDGMYQVEKAGYRGADGLAVLKTASQGAREEGANLATVTSAMTSIMQSYHVPVKDNVSVMNQLKTAAGESKTTMEQFAGSLATVLPVASANGISFAKVAGALATLTQHGTSADEATQELANTIRNLAAPNMVAVKEMSQLGISSQDVSQKLGQRGVAGTLNYLSQTVLRQMGPAGKVLLDTFNKSQAAGADAHAMMAKMPPEVRKIAQGFLDGSIHVSDWGKAMSSLPVPQANLLRQFATMENKSHGFNSAIRQGLPGTQTYTEAIKKMTGGANGLNTTLQLTGESTAGTTERIKRIADSAKGAGKDVSGWASTQKLFNVQMDMFKERIQVLAVRIGTALMPRILATAKALGGMLDFVQRNQKWLVPLATSAVAVAAGIVLVSKAVKAWTTVQLVLDAAMSANPIGLLIIGVAALAAGIIYAYKHSATFRKIIQDIGHWFVTAGKDVIKWGKDFGHWVADGFRTVAGAVSGMYHAVVGWVTKTYHDVTGWFGKMWDGLTGWVSRIYHDVTKWVSNMYHDVTGFFSKMWKGITGFVDLIAATVKKHWRLLLTIATLGAGFIVVLIVNHWKKISKFFTDGWHFVSGITLRMWHDITGFFSKGVADVEHVNATILAVSRKIWNVVWGTVSGITSRMWRDVSGFFNRGLAAVEQVNTTILNINKKIWNAVWGAVSGFAKRIWADVRHFWGLVQDVNHTILRTIHDENSRIWHGIWDTVTGFASRIWSSVKRSFNNLKGDLSNILGKTGVQHVFSSAVSAIGTIWHGLESLAKKPISFIVNTVLNHGLIPAWNWVAGQLHESGMHVNPIKLAGFKDGGRTGLGGDNEIAGFAHANEHYATASEVRQTPGGHSTWERMRGLIRQGITDWLPGYAAGGRVWPTNTHRLSATYPGHSGVDIAAGMGAPIYAAEAGRISYTGWNRGFGQAIFEWLRGGLSAVYGHTSQLLTRAGLAVSAGQLIGRVGATGHATGPHLHFEINSPGPFGNSADRANTLNFLRGADVSGGGGGGGFGSIIDYLGILGGKVKAGLAGLAGLGHSPWVQLVSGLPKMVAGWLLDKAKGAITSLFGTADPTKGFGTKGSNQQRGHSLMLQYGWPEAQWPALDKLWTRESGWNERASNPSSGAYGIPQALPGSKMSSVGADWRGNPNTQIMWGLQYIKSRYGSPGGAWGHELSAGWYDQGGLASGRGLMPKNTIRPERVLPPHETQVYDELLAVLKAQGGLGARGPLVHVDTVSAKVDLDAFAREAEFRARQGSFT